MRIGFIPAAFIFLAVVQSCLNLDDRDRSGRYDDSAEFISGDPADSSSHCPVIMLEIPDEANNLEPLIIRGLGFEQGQRLLLRGGDGTDIELEWQLSPVGISSAIPPTMPVGKYDLVLSVPSTGKEWVLAADLDIKVKMDLTAVKYIDATTYDIAGVPARTLADAASSYGMDVEEFQTFLQSMGYADSSTTTGYRIERDADGYVSKLVWINDDSSSDAYTFIWNSAHDEVKAVNNTFESGYDMVVSYSWRIEDGRAVEMTEETEKRESHYVLKYDAYGHLFSQQTHTGYEYNSFAYNGDNCYTGLSGNTLFTYTDNSPVIQDIPINVPAAVQDGLYHFSFSSPDADWLPLLNMAGLCGKGSPMTPTRLLDPATRKLFDISYDIDEYGFVRSASWKTEGQDGFFGFIPVTTSTTVYFEYNGL